MLQDAGQAMIDLGTALEPDAGAHTGNETRLTLACNQMEGGGYNAVSEPLGVDPLSLSQAWALICAPNNVRCATADFLFQDGRARVPCGPQPGWTAHIRVRD